MLYEVITRWPPDRAASFAANRARLLQHVETGKLHHETGAALGGGSQIGGKAEVV